MATQTSNSLSDFENLLKRLSGLVYAKSSNERTLLRNILEQFNAINYSVPLMVSNEKASLAVNQCCSLASKEDSILSHLVLELFFKLVEKQKVILEGKTLSLATKWVLDCVKASDAYSTNLALEVLQHLIRGKSSVLEENGAMIVNICENVMAVAIAEHPPNMYFNCLSCLEALNYNHYDSSVSHVVEKSCDIFIYFLYNANQISNPLWQAKCLITALRGLDNIVRNNYESVASRLPEIIGAIRGFMLYQIRGYEDSPIERALPSNLPLPEERKQTKSAKKPMGKYDRKSKKKIPTPISNVVSNEEEDPLNSRSYYVGAYENQALFKRDVTSDSDFSDSEGGNAAKVRLTQSKVRRCSLILLGSVILKGDIRIVISYMPSILPDGRHKSRNLVSCLSSDTSHCCRSEALLVLSIIFSKFKRFFSLADSTTSSSFTTWANTVAVILKEIHSALIISLRNENYKVVTMHILKALSDLIRCTPYYKINEPLLIPIAKEVVFFLKKNDVNIRIAALVVFGCLTSVTPKVPDIEQIVIESKTPHRRPWLLEQCWQMLSDDKGCNPAIAIECLQVLATLVRSFPTETVVNHFEQIALILEFMSSEHDDIIRLYAAKFLEAVVESLQSCVTCEEASKRVSAAVAANIWTKVVLPAVTSLMQCEEQAALRSAASDCLANLAVTSETIEASLIFDELPRQDQIVSITHLLGCTKDESAQVRSSAVRALAAFVRFPMLREDPLFLLDAVDAFFLAAEDESIAVKVQAAWLLSHLSDAFLANRNEGADDDVTDTMLFRLINAGIKLTKDVKKGKPYADRGIANLLSTVQEETAANHKEDVSRAIEMLLLNCSTGSYMKARWNACYALGVALTNPPVCAEARSTALPVLFQLVQSYKNFKVRISAGQALCSLPTRESYGDLFLQTWRSLLCGLENAENMQDFSEYQHRDHLVDTLCSALCWLVSLLVHSDLIPIQELLVHYIDLLSHNFDRFKNRVVPEKGSVILKADAKLSELVGCESLNGEQRNALSLLCGIFMCESGSNF